MSRIEKGGARFKPMMPRKEGPSEKSRSITGTTKSDNNKPPSSVASSFTQSQAAATTTNASDPAPISSESVLAIQIRTQDNASQPLFLPELQPMMEQSSDTETTRVQTTQNCVPNVQMNSERNAIGAPSTSKKQPSAVPLVMPSSSGRGTAIVMPGQRREAPITIYADITLTRESQSPMPPPLATPLPPPPSSQPPTIENRTVTNDREVEASNLSPSRQQRRARQESDGDQNGEDSNKKRKRRRTTKVVPTIEFSTENSSPSRRMSGLGRLKKREVAREGDTSPPHEETGQVVGDEEEQRENDADSSSGEVKTTKRRQRRARPRVDRAIQEVPEEGPPLDETTATMKDLCNGVVQGRVSGRFLETFIKRNEDAKRKREENTRLRDFARRKELGLPMEDQEMVEMNIRSRRGRIVAQEEPMEEREGEGNTEGNGEGNVRASNEEDEYSGVAQTTHRAPQVRYDASGNLVLDEAELEYNRQEEAEAELAANGPMEVVVETDRDKFTNFASYSRKPKPERWSKEEMDTFYMGLRMFHTGFDLIARLLPNRTRTMVRNKFRTEDRKNPEKITRYLSPQMRLPYDLELLSRETGYDFDGPLPAIEEPQAADAEEGGGDGEGDKEHDLSVKRRLSTAPLSGGESDRGDGTSVSTARGRTNTQGKGRQKPKHPINTSKPSSAVIARGTSAGVASAVTNSEGAEPSQEASRRPPTIASSTTVPTVASNAPKIRTTTSTMMGRNTLVLPGGGREFRRDD
ncbi:Transcription factor TFIIIB component B [Serendipita sp. 400]|nr:Transcription factor TFIIIB component B [Serendipita sp. 400]